jgi:GAF domain-containing protein
MNRPEFALDDVLQAAETLTSIASRLHAAPGPQAIATQVVAVSVELIPHATAASVTVRGARGRLATVGQTSPLALAVDQAQYAAADGPCQHAIRSGEVVRVADLAADPRWPTLAAVPLRSALVIPLPQLRPNPLAGSVNLYAEAPGAFPPVAERLGRMVAIHAATALAATTERDHLIEALASRDIIGQAKGILMREHSITSERAFSMLTHASQHDNRKLRDVAARVVEVANSAARDDANDATLMLTLRFRPASAIGAAFLAIGGAVDAVGAAAIGGFLAQTISGRPKDAHAGLTVDLSGTTSLAGNVPAMLAAVRDQLAAIGGRLSLVGAPPAIERAYGPGSAS